MTKLTDEINSYIPINQVGGVSATDMRDAILALNNGALTVNDIATGSIASITIVGMYEGNKDDLTDSPPAAATGAVYILATKTELDNWTYYLTDNTAALFTGVRLVGNNTITWKASGDGTGGGGTGNLLSDGSVPMDVGYDPGTEIDAQVLATKAYVDSLGGSIPSSYPKGIVGEINQSNVDAVSQAVTVSVPMVGVAGRIYRASASINFLSNSETNGEVTYSFTTRTDTQGIERQDFGSFPVFDMQLSSTARTYSFVQKFNKDTSGFAEFTFQLKGQWNLPTDLSVDFYIADLGEGTVAPPTVPEVEPTVIQSVIYDTQRDAIWFNTDIEMTASGVEGITFPGKTPSAITFETGNWAWIQLDSDVTYNDTGSWSYDDTVFNSDLRSLGANVELPAGTFVIDNQINQPPTIDNINLPDMLTTTPTLQITQAELLAGSNDPEGDPLTAQNMSINVGLGSLVFDNPDWTYTQAGVSDVQFAYEITDGDYIVPNVAFLTVKDPVTEMTITGAARNTARRVDIDLDENLVAPSTDTIANANFSFDQGVVIDRVTQNNPGTNVLNIYAVADIPTGVALNLTYTKDNGGENVVSVAGSDYPNGAQAINNP